MTLWHAKLFCVVGGSAQQACAAAVAAIACIRQDKATGPSPPYPRGLPKQRRKPGLLASVAAEIALACACWCAS